MCSTFSLLPSLLLHSHSTLSQSSTIFPNVFKDNKLYFKFIFINMYIHSDIFGCWLTKLPEVGIIIFFENEEKLVEYVYLKKRVLYSWSVYKHLPLKSDGGFDHEVDTWTCKLIGKSILVNINFDIVSLLNTFNAIQPGEVFKEGRVWIQKKSMFLFPGSLPHWWGRRDCKTPQGN